MMALCLKVALSVGIHLFFLNAGGRGRLHFGCLQMLVNAGQSILHEYLLNSLHLTREIACLRLAVSPHAVVLISFCHSVLLFYPRVTLCSITYCMTPDLASEPLFTCAFPELCNCDARGHFSQYVILARKLESWQR